MARIAIDTGGTFTDLVGEADDGRIVRLKIPSTPDDPSRAVIAALDAMAEKLGAAPVIEELRHGTTVGTNALLQRRGANIGLVTNCGFEDLLRLGRQDRPDLYDLHPEVAPPLVPPSRCFGIVGRLDPFGAEITKLEDVAAWIERHHDALAACEALAICLLHAYASDRHEARVAAALRAAFGDTPVTVSSELVPLEREYERASTVAVNAYLSPGMSRYIDRLGERIAPTRLRIMGSGGGLLPAARVAREPVRTVLSGPAGGVRGAAEVGKRCGRTRLLCLDMGGTSADISVVHGELQPEEDGALNEHILRTPMLPIVTIGAGGGSIAYVDAGGALRVGPRSAGAVPGPAAYGRAGPDGEPTVTDANIVLERLDTLLGGSMTLDRDAAAAAVGRLAARLGASSTDTAVAILRITEANMARACKRVTMERGIDPRELSLVAFGGAGGLHACALADELGCPEVIFPAAPGVLSAEGILAAPNQAVVIRSEFLDEADWGGDRLAGLLADCAAAALTELGRETSDDEVGSAQLQILADCRYRGQSFQLAVEVTELAGSSDTLLTCPARLRAAFEALHTERYGYALGETAAIELVALRAFARLPAAGLSEPTVAAPTELVGERTVATYGATLYLPTGWRAERQATGDLLCHPLPLPDEVEQGKGQGQGAREALGLEIHRQRLTSIAEEMGAALMRASFSANIKERRDFSCALFDARGRMLVQAAHIPVHLGSQQLSVEAAIADVEMVPGMSVILNDPYRGGTHLPDVTLVTPVFLSGNAGGTRPAYYVANRAHHADIGGLQPGSMPAATDRSLTIDDEGWRSPPVPLTDAVRDDFARASRTPQERYGDLRAQEAANHVGVTRLHELASHFDPRLDDALLDYTERRMRAILAELPDGVYDFEDCLDSDGYIQGHGGGPVRIPVTLEIRGDQARVDFCAAPPMVPSALNTVRAVVVSAVFYVFRCLGGAELPSNAGLLRPIEIITKPGTVCDATPPAAVSAGNVETSQRLVDVVLGALAQAIPERIPAASCGSMNNILFGGIDTRPGIYAGEPFVHYETIAGGAGAGPTGDGASAIHTHMTNTLNTPVEALERSFPVRIETYAVRPATSGGDGLHRGGAGVRREYHFLAPAQVTLMTERRETAPWGLAGGEAGATGRNSVRDAGDDTVRTLPGKTSFEIAAGETLIIETPGGGGWGHTAASGHRPKL